MGLAELVQRIQEVCPLPATAQRVAQLAGSEDARIEEVASVIATDPALAAEMMRIANSAAYGRARQVAELEQAVVLIGLSEIQRIAAAMAMLAAFHTKHELEFGFHDRAVVAGSISRTIAPRISGVDRGAAFLCGLLADIGAMACAAVDSVGYRQLWKEARDVSHREELERMRFGASSRQIGAELLRRNGLPELIAAAVESEATTADASMLVRLTRFSRLAAGLLVSAAKSGDKAAFAEGLAALQEASGLSVPYEELLDACLKAGGTARAALKKHR